MALRAVVAQLRATVAKLLGQPAPPAQDVPWPRWRARRAPAGDVALFNRYAAIGNDDEEAIEVLSS